MNKTIKKYTLTTRYGRITLTMLDKWEDGYIHSISCEYPLFLQKVNDKGELMIIKQTRKQTEEYLLKLLLGQTERA